MSKLSKILEKVKTKVGVGAIAATLVLTPSGVALAHGGNNNTNWDNHNRQAQSWNNDKHDKKNKDNDRRNDRNNQNRLTCEERQDRANQQFTDFKNRTQQRYNGLSLYLTNQQTFVTDNNLSIEKYDELNNKATEAQTNANNAISNAQAPTIDCNKSQKKDSEVIYRSIWDMHKTIDRFEDKIQALSHVIADKIVVS